MTEDEILAKLDPGQRAAATFHTGSAVVTAVAGAGKTTMIVHRVAHLVQVRKVPADRILVVTFATKGARELETRIAAMLGVPGSFRTGRTPRVGTWHSLAWEIVRMHGGQRWTIDDRGKYGTILKQVTGYQGMRWQSVDHDVLQGFIGFCKAHLAAPDSDLAISIAEELHAKTGGSSTDPEKLLEAYERAEAARVTAGLLTFDDQLVEAAKLLEDAAVRERVASRWDFIIQDEAQDQNLAQMTIGAALAQDHGNYMLVGDSSQTIYTWRGAISRSLSDFVRDGATPIRMERTYRCPKRVVARANLILRALGVPPMVPAREDLGKVTGTVAETGLDEARAITGRIQEQLAGGTKPSDIAVLLRVGDMIQPIEDQLVSAKIPYRVVGGVSYFERKEVASLLSYLRIAAGVGTTVDVDRTLRAPFRFLSVKAIEAVVATARQHPELSWEQVVEKACVEAPSGASDRATATLRTWASLLNVITWRRMRVKRADETAEAYADLPGSEVAPEPALRTVVESTRYIEWLQKEDGADTPENNRVKNVQDLLRIAGRFQTAGEFLAYVEKAMKAAAAARNAKAYGDVVTLSTIHRAKGLEWPVVFVGGLVDGMFPHSKADITEELRLLYVAVTRAKETLYVSGVKSQPSRFRDDDDATTTPRFLRTLGFDFDTPPIPGVRFPYEEVVLPVDRKGVPNDPEDEYDRERMYNFDRPGADDDDDEDEDDLEDPS